MFNHCSWFVLFFLFNYDVKRKKSTQRKRKHVSFLRLHYVQPFSFSALPNHSSLANLRFALQTMLGLNFVRLTKRIINVQERTTKQVLFECHRHEFTCSARLLQLINEWSYSARGFLCNFFAGTKKLQ